MSSTMSDDAQKRFITIWENVECGISIIDAETREILAINPVAARMFGGDAEKIIGKRCHQFICPAQENSCPIMDKGQVVDRSERVFVRADGTTVPIIKSVAKIQYNGRLALLESFTDISTLKHAEEELRRLQVTEKANQAKSDFLSRMSHDMRTPMNAIIGMTRIAEKTNDVGKLRYCLSTIESSASHLLELINDVLDLAKIEAGKFELNTGPVDIEKILSNICNLVGTQIEEKNIALRTSFSPGMGMRYTGDALRLSQVIANLVSNAVKFTPQGGAVTLSAAHTGNTANGGAALRFTVSDTGIGMPPDQIARLFNAYEQADSSISGRYGGTGLGLVIVKKIIEKMNGTITVESVPQKGASFIVDIELEPIDEPPATDDVAGKTVLVLDGDPDHAAQFAQMARHLGIRADIAENTGDARARIAQFSYDAVFVDPPHVTGLVENMPPDMDAGRIVVAASLLQWSSMDAATQAAGIRNFLQKPLFPSAIADAVRSAAAAAPEAPCARQGEIPDFSRVRLLLAEDVAINREILASLLEETGVAIDMAENGQQAVDMFKKNPERYDLILMDVQMPVMNGHEATAAIRALEEEQKRIPIFAMTADVFTSDIEKCLACGMNGHLAKPIDEKAVINVILSCCK